MATPTPSWLSVLTRSLDNQLSPPIALKQAFIDASLHLYQKTAIDFGLQRGGRVLLGHEMGLGKTPMAISIAAHCLAAGKGPVLVVAPPVLLDQWRSEILQWHPYAKSSDVQIIAKGSDQILPASKWIILSYSVLVGTTKQPNAHLHTPVGGGCFHIIICDEAHALKGVDSHRTLSLLPMLRRAAHAILMTGTPMANACAQDVYPLLDALCGASGAMPCLRLWNERFCLENRKVYTGYRYIDRWVGLSAEHGDELHALLSRVMVRKRKEEVLHELPPK